MVTCSINHKGLAMSPEMQLQWDGEIYKQYMQEEKTTFSDIDIRIKNKKANIEDCKHMGQQYSLWKAGPFWWVKSIDGFEDAAWDKAEAVRLIKKHIDQIS